MFNKEKGILQKIKNKLSKHKGVLKVIVYGSRIRGDFTADSDFDVLVVVRKKDKQLRDNIVDIFYSYELETGIPFSVAIFPLDRLKFNKKLGSPFIKNMEKEGIVLYDAKQRRKKDSVRIPFK